MISGLQNGSGKLAFVLEMILGSVCRGRTRMQTKALCAASIVAIVSAVFSLRVMAGPISFDVPLTSSSEVPPEISQAKGLAKLMWDSTTRVVSWEITATGLTGPATMAHFHRAPPGKNGSVTVWLSAQGDPAVFPIKGERTLTPEQADEFEGGQWYVNVHTKAHPSGEIRGQVQPPKK